MSTNNKPPVVTVSRAISKWQWRSVAGPGGRTAAQLLEAVGGPFSANDPVLFALREDWMPSADPERAAARALVERASQMFILMEELAQYAQDATLENDPLPECVVLAQKMSQDLRSKYGPALALADDPVKEPTADHVVTFEVQVTADSPQQAAKFALDDLRDVTLGSWNARVVNGRDVHNVQVPEDWEERLAAG